MSHLTAPAVSQGFSNNMSDIIDSLKRLERVGDASSKTVEKIIAAALNVEEQIAKQYKHSSQAQIEAPSILRRIAAEKECSPIEAAQSVDLDYQRVCGMRYSVQWAGPYNFSVERSGRGERVSASRESALAFASDLAAGLLKLVELDLRQRLTEEDTALDVLTTFVKPTKNEDDDIPLELA